MVEEIRKSTPSLVCCLQTDIVSTALLCRSRACFFLLLTNSFSEQQTSALEDSIEASIMCKLSTMIKNFVLNFGHYR